MSYCRFSSDDWQSDIYCYEHCGAWWQIHVAGNRRQLVEPLPPRVSLDDGPAWTARQLEVQRILDASPRVPLGLGADGANFQEANAAACLDRLLDLRGMGYHVPEFALDALREEAAC